MSKKKSYMNVSNIIKEGILDKIFDFIKKHKIRKLEKAFKDQPEVRKKIKHLNDLALETEKVLKKYGIDDKIHRIK
tara:strand:+ start:58 stop:285 length:228 start_codon:yes stop_codon:yes gene_type:complete